METKSPSPQTDWRPGQRKARPRNCQLSARVTEDFHTEVLALNAARQERFPGETISQTLENALAYFLKDPYGDALRFAKR